MPESPAPMTSTSRCSTGPGAGCDPGSGAGPGRDPGSDAVTVTASGRRPGSDELVVEGARLAEQPLAPLGHQHARVAVVGVEVAPVVLLELAPEGPAEKRRPPHPAPAPAQVARPVGGPVAEQRQADLQRHPGHERGPDDLHGKHTGALAAADRPVDVEGDSLVLRLLQRVPQEEVADNTAIRDDIGENLEAIEELDRRFSPELVLV